MHPLRDQVKAYLVGAGSRCPHCKERGFQLHEIVCPLRPKYNPLPKDEPLARVVYLPQNCVLLCAEFNVIDANSRRDELIAWNMGLYGIDAVVGMYKSMAKLLKSPQAWIPTSVMFRGKLVRIL